MVNKRGVFSNGINAHENCDNLITLSRSSSDLHLGLLDYLFYKILNCDPDLYFDNESENIFNLSDISESERKTLQNEYLKYESEPLNKSLKKEIKDFVIEIREKSIKKNLIRKSFGCSYIEKSLSFGAEFILKELIKFYKKKGE